MKDIDDLVEDPTNKRLSWRHGISSAITQRDMHLKELRNWIERKVKPTRSSRTRG
jgi:hypothetical protein